MQTKGFTLIELLVVILIIGILATIALPQYQVAVDKASYTQLQSTVDALVKAEGVYFDKKGHYTNDLDALSIDFIARRWVSSTVSNGFGEEEVLSRNGTFDIKNGYISIDYAAGKTPRSPSCPNGCERGAYIYGYNSKIGVEYVYFLPRTAFYPDQSGHSYCIVTKGKAESAGQNKRGIRLCKALGGDNNKEPKGIDENYYLLR